MLCEKLTLQRLNNKLPLDVTEIEDNLKSFKILYSITKGENKYAMHVKQLQRQWPLLG